MVDGEFSFVCSCIKEAEGGQEDNEQDRIAKQQVRKVTAFKDMQSCQIFRQIVQLKFLIYSKWDLYGLKSSYCPKCINSCLPLAPS